MKCSLCEKELTSEQEELGGYCYSCLLIQKNNLDQQVSQLIATAQQISSCETCGQSKILFHDCPVCLKRDLDYYKSLLLLDKENFDKEIAKAIPQKFSLEAQRTELESQIDKLQTKLDAAVSMLKPLAEDLGCDIKSETNPGKVIDLIRGFVATSKVSEGK